MKNLATSTKIQFLVEKYLLKKIAELKEHLLSGDILTFEKSLRCYTDEVYNNISEILIKESSKELLTTLYKQARQENLTRLKQRMLGIQIGTGHVVKAYSLYANGIPANFEKSRHLLANHWTIISNASLAYIDKVCMSSVLCPSYSIANQLLMNFSVNQGISRVRKLTNDVGLYCKEIEVELNLETGENLAGKRVVIGVDGGRTRTRIYQGEKNNKGNAKFETKWREPKLFVIYVIDKNGQLDIQHRPIYGCRFEPHEVLELLRAYLKALKIDKCKEVQILADGAPWIWNNVKQILLELSVGGNRIIETLDYYHAIGYVNSLIQSLPLKYNEEERAELLKQFKEWLWEGQSNKIALKCKELYKRPNKLVKRWINYLDKHANKTQYANYQSDKLMCGSGIIESGIRRIINLKFKSPGIFWDESTVESLFFFAPLFYLIVGIPF